MADPHHLLGNDGWPATRDQLVEAGCLFGVDQVRGQRDVTDFKRRARWHQSQWRIAQGLPIGTHRPIEEQRPNGSRIPVDLAVETGANFLSNAIRNQVRRRRDHHESHQTLDETRLWSDLLSSMPMCFNLFGEAADDPARLAAAVDALWPTHPGTAIELRFEWSPGRRDRTYLSNRTAFDAAVLLHLDEEDRQGVIGIETKYHEHVKRERAPSDTRRMPRYREVTERSGVFANGWEQVLAGTDLQQIWLDHLLVLAMLQHPSGHWAWGRYVLAYPAANPSVRAAAERYREVLVDDTTFEVRTIEELLEPGVLHPPTVATTFRDRYLWNLT